MTNFLPHRHNGPMSCECVLENFMNRKSERLTVHSESDLPQSSPKQVHHQAHYYKVAESQSEIATVQCRLCRVSTLRFWEKGAIFTDKALTNAKTKYNNPIIWRITADTAASVVDSNLIQRSDPDSRSRISRLADVPLIKITFFQRFSFFRGFS